MGSFHHNLRAGPLASCLVFDADVPDTAGLTCVRIRALPSVAAIAAALSACEKIMACGLGAPPISCTDMAAFNDAVRHCLPESVEVALAYCDSLFFLAWRSNARSENRVTAGVDTVTLMVTAMEAWPGKSDVQCKGANVMANLAV